MKCKLEEDCIEKSIYGVIQTRLYYEYGVAQQVSVSHQHWISAEPVKWLMGYRKRTIYVCIYTNWLYYR